MGTDMTLIPKVTRLHTCSLVNITDQFVEGKLKTTAQLKAQVGAIDMHMPSANTTKAEGRPPPDRCSLKNAMSVRAQLHHRTAGAVGIPASSTSRVRGYHQGIADG
eukprot:1647676-Amphidinium_carterae.1